MGLAQAKLSKIKNDEYNEDPNSGSEFDEIELPVLQTMDGEVNFFLLPLFLLLVLVGSPFCEQQQSQVSMFSDHFHSKLKDQLPTFNHEQNTVNRTTHLYLRITQRKHT